MWRMLFRAGRATYKMSVYSISGKSYTNTLILKSYNLLYILGQNTADFVQSMWPNWP